MRNNNKPTGYGSVLGRPRASLVTNIPSFQRKSNNNKRGRKKYQIPYTENRRVRDRIKTRTVPDFHASYTERSTRWEYGIPKQVNSITYMIIYYYFSCGRRRNNYSVIYTRRSFGPRERYIVFFF